MYHHLPNLKWVASILLFIPHFFFPFSFMEITIHIRPTPPQNFTFKLADMKTRTIWNIHYQQEILIEFYKCRCDQFAEEDTKKKDW